MCPELLNLIEAAEKLRTVEWANQPSSTHGDHAVALVQAGSILDAITVDAIAALDASKEHKATGDFSAADHLSRRCRTRHQSNIAFPTCDHDGCDIRSNHSEIDHLLAWIDGGPTDIANLRPRCKGHNLWKEHITAKTRRRRTPP